MVIINFHGGKNQFFLLCQAQISVLATRARVTLTFDWLAFAVKLVLVGSCIWKIAQGGKNQFLSPASMFKGYFQLIFNLFSLDKSYNLTDYWIFDLKVLHL